MTALEKRKEEQEELLKNRKNRILNAAFTLFSEKGIDTIAMTDIAKNAEIGVASLYRYYETKDEIAIQTAIWAWENQKEAFMPGLNDSTYESKNGIEQLEHIFNLYGELYKTNSQFLRFIYFFDSYAVRTGISQERLKDYEKIILSISNVVLKAIEKGLSDTSISGKYKKSTEGLCFSIMQTMFSLLQKLTLNQNLLQIDSDNNSNEAINLLSSIILKGLKE